MFKYSGQSQEKENNSSVTVQVIVSVKRQLASLRHHCVRYYTSLSTGGRDLEALLTHSSVSVKGYKNH